jgi:hypothetical protein
MPAIHPVHYFVPPRERFSRLQLAIRVVAFLALGLVGLSFGMVFLFFYLAFPVFVASRLTDDRQVVRFPEQDRRRVLAVLRWFAAVSAWVGLVADRLPRRSPEETVTLDIDNEGRAAPDARSALMRVLTGLPSALFLAILGMIGVLVWLWAALSILFAERVGPNAFRYLVGLQRWSIRLLAYQASLVDEYPPFSFADVPPPPERLPGAQAGSSAHRSVSADR